MQNSTLASSSRINAMPFSPRRACEKEMVESSDDDDAVVRNSTKHRVQRRVVGSDSETDDDGSFGDISRAHRNITRGRNNRIVDSSSDDEDDDDDESDIEFTTEDVKEEEEEEEEEELGLFCPLLRSLGIFCDASTEAHHTIYMEAFLHTYVRTPHYVFIQNNEYYYI